MLKGNPILGEHLYHQLVYQGVCRAFQVFYWKLFISCIIADCQSLFLRHTQSGQCITKGRLVINTPDRALPYFAVMSDNCLGVESQFRYLNNSELLQNIETGGTFRPTHEKVYRSRLTLFNAVANTSLKYQISPVNHLKQTAAGGLSFHNVNACAQKSKTSSYMGKSPCCNNAEQKFTFGKCSIYYISWADTFLHGNFFRNVEWASRNDVLLWFFIITVKTRIREPLFLWQAELVFNYSAYF